MSISRPKVQLMLLYGCTANKAKDFEVEKKVCGNIFIWEKWKNISIEKVPLINCSKAHWRIQIILKNKQMY